MEGSKKTLALGAYPDTSLAQARDQREAARKLLVQDIDPGAQRKHDKHERRISQENTFEAVACDWMKTKGKEWTDGYAAKTRTCLERHALPSIGSKPIKEITAPELLTMLRVIEKRGEVTTKVAMQMLARTFQRTKEVRFGKSGHRLISMALCGAFLQKS